MKKFLTLVIAALLVFAFTGCAANNASPAVDSSAPVESAASQPPSPSSDSQTPAAPSDTAAASSAPANTGATPADSYARYMDAKSKAYDAISAKLEEQPELSLDTAMPLLSVATVDLSMLGLTVMNATPDASKIALEMLGNKNVDVKVDGNHYSVTYTSSEDEQFTQTAEYDAATDSVRSVLTSSKDGEMITMEYVKIGGGYASQYITAGDDASVLTCFADGQDIAFGIDSTTEKPASIFKNTAVAEDFIKNDDLYIILKDGKMTVNSKGKETTF